MSRGAASPPSVQLRSENGRVEARIVPRAGCAVVSMRIDGREWLRLPEPLASWVRHERTGGVPLLFPWGNRLRSDHYEVLRRRVDLRRAAHVHRDGAGRPMHGLLLRWDRWELAGAGEDAPSSLRAELDWRRHRDLHRAFPFDFVLRLRWRAFETGSAAAGLEIETEVESFDAPVPLAFGWHPYLALPGPRAKCVLFTPPLSRVALNCGIPRRSRRATERGARSGARPRVGAVEHGAAGALQLAPPAILGPSLGRAAIDDLYAGVTDGASVSVEIADRAKRSITVEFVRGYRYVQLFAPRGADFICVEPMMAPTAALSDAAPELPLLGPRRRASALFRIVVRHG